MDPYNVTNINSSNVSGISETTLPLQGIIGSVNIIKMQIRHNTGGSANGNQTFRTHMNHYSKVNQLIRTAMLFPDLCFLNKIQKI